MNMHLASALASRVVGGNDFCPQPTSGTELGDFHEVVGADTKIEFDLLGHFRSVQACLGQLSQQFVSPSQCISQLLRDISTCIVEVEGIHCQYFVTRQSSTRFEHSGSSFHPVFIFLTFYQRFLERVVVYRPFAFFQVCAFAFEIVGENTDQHFSLAVASIEIQFHTLRTNPVK